VRTGPEEFLGEDVGRDATLCSENRDRPRKIPALIVAD
jgi:hypothetical protein